MLAAPTRLYRNGAGPYKDSTRIRAAGGPRPRYASLHFLSQDGE